MIQEVYKKIIDFEDYEISNYGNVKSLKFGNYRILKPYKNKSGYYSVALCVDCKIKKYFIHQLVAIAFLNHIPNKMGLVINHKDSDKENNFAYNLEIVTQRENIHKKENLSKKTSKYTGVSFCKKSNKWRSQIYNKKVISLGFYNTEIEASNVYKKALKKITK